MSRKQFTLEFVVDAAHHGLRIDTFLSSCLRNLAPARLQRIAAAGLVTVDDALCEADRRVRTGEEVRVRLAEPCDPFYEPESTAIDVLYDDPWLMAVNKPAGMIMHPAGPVGSGTVANAVQGMLNAQTRLPGLLRPGIVHRLDRETSGVVLIAKDHVAHASLTKQFERAAVRKIYLALVEGSLASGSDTIDLPIGKRPDSLLMTTGDAALSPRRAVTSFRVVRRLRSATLVEVLPHTGRKHQIRVHFASMGYPVRGDEHYGTTSSKSPQIGPDPQSVRRHALHAVTIAFRHPVSNSAMRVVAPVPTDFWSVLASQS